MRIGIVGAGAIGGLLAAKLALAGEDVTVVDRGAHLAAIQANGIKLRMGDGSEHVAKNLRAVESCAAAGKQDLVILALKAHVIASVAPSLEAMMDGATMVMTAQNGLSWWYFQRHGGPLDGKPLARLDPDGAIAKHVDAKRIIGCVVYPAAEISAPGVIHHVEGDRFAIGELDDTPSERVKALAETLTKSGFKGVVAENIRAEVWLKLWGNMTFNPISALTHATLVDICQFPPTRELAAAMMREAQAVAGKLGITFRVPLDKRIAGAEKVGKHKTSTLQDIEAGREIETDALLGVVIEMARLTETPVPACETVLALLELLAKTLKDAHAAARIVQVAA